VRSEFWELLAKFGRASLTVEFRDFGKSIVPHRIQHKARLALVANADSEKGPVVQKLTEARQNELIHDLSQILEELDTFGPSLAAIHIVSAIDALHSVEVQLDGTL
jgi:hypothetical protein